MESFKKVNYKMKNYQGYILVNNNIEDEKEIKELCFKDYLEKLSQRIEIVKEK